MKRTAKPKVITLRYAAVCRECSESIPAGETAAWRPYAHASHRVAHTYCDALVEARDLRSRAFTLGPWGRLLDEEELRHDPRHLAGQRLVCRAEQIEARVAAARAAAIPATAEAA